MQTNPYATRISPPRTPHHTGFPLPAGALFQLFFIELRILSGVHTYLCSPIPASLLRFRTIQTVERRQSFEKSRLPGQQLIKWCSYCSQQDFARTPKRFHLHSLLHLPCRRSIVVDIGHFPSPARAGANWLASLGPGMAPRTFL